MQESMISQGTRPTCSSRGSMVIRGVYGQDQGGPREALSFRVRRLGLEGRAPLSKALVEWRGGLPQHLYQVEVQGEPFPLLKGSPGGIYGQHQWGQSMVDTNGGSLLSLPMGAQGDLVGMIC